MPELLLRSGNEVGTTREPVWRGPEEDGITYSLLSRYLVCKERFRIYVMDGLRSVEQFNHRIEYGSMFHLCDEYHGKGERWLEPLKRYASSLCKKHPLDQERIEHWYHVCLVQYPLYLAHWGREMKPRRSVEQEKVFSVDYRLPTGRIVKLKGKWDALDLIGESLHLWENKVKGDIVEEQILRQLSFDLQTMLYAIAARRAGYQVRGVIYNVIRRPLSGGKGSIRQHKPSKAKPEGESKAAFYQRLSEEVISPELEYYFKRWQVTLVADDFKKFERECLIPLLENLCDDYEWWRLCWENGFSPFSDWENRPETHYARHYRTPYGFWNTLERGGMSELDEYLATGSELGLERVSDLFSELEECQR